LQRPRHPFLVAHPAALATGGHPSSLGVNARTRCIARSLAARCSSGPLRECASARGREGVWERYCAIPGAVMYFYLHSCLFPFFSLVFESLM
jgi:hypothetical protein